VLGLHGSNHDGKGQRWPIRLMSAAGVKVLRWVKIRSEAILRSDVGTVPGGTDGWKWGTRLQDGVGSSPSGRIREADVWFVDNRCKKRISLACHHRRWRCFGGPETLGNLELLHANCHRQIHARKRN